MDIRFLGSVFIMTGIALLFGYGIVRSILHKKRRDHLLSRGHRITARVIRVKKHKHAPIKYGYKFETKRYGDMGDSTITVQFKWDNESIQTELLHSVPNGRYKCGMAMDILYLPEYPNDVISADVLPYTLRPVVIFALGFLFFLLFLWYKLI